MGNRAATAGHPAPPPCHPQGHNSLHTRVSPLWFVAPLRRVERRPALPPAPVRHVLRQPTAAHTAAVRASGALAPPPARHPAGWRGTDSQRRRPGPATPSRTAASQVSLPQPPTVPVRVPVAVAEAHVRGLSLVCGDGFPANESPTSDVPSVARLSLCGVGSRYVSLYEKDP